MRLQTKQSAVGRIHLMIGRINSMGNANRTFEIHKQADLLTAQVKSLRQYLKDSGGGMWKDVVITELACVLERLAIIKCESAVEFNEKFNERKAS